MENEYEGLLPDENTLKQSLHASKESDPAQFGKVVELSRKQGLPSDFVEQNYEELSREEEIDYDDLIQNNPKLSEYLSDIENAKVSKDDIMSLSKIEKGMADLEKTGNLIRAMTSGGLSMFSGVLKSTSGIVDFTEKIPGSIVRAVPKEDRNKIKDLLLKNPVTDQLDEWSKSINPDPVNQDDILTNFKNGELYPIAIEVARNAPQLVLTSINPKLGLTLMGASSFGQKLRENIDKGIDRDTAIQNAIFTAGAEVGIESLGGIGSNPLKDSIKNAIGELGEQSVKNTLIKSFGLIGKNAGQEGFEESLTETSQAVIDWAMDVNPDALNGVFRRSINAGIVGSFAGGGATAVGVGAVEGSRLWTKDIEDFQKRANVNQSSEFYKDMGEKVNESKTYANSPIKMEEYLDKQTKDSAVESIHIETEKFDEYFQKKGISPEQAAKDFGFEKEYNEAKETGSDLAVKTSKWTTSLAKTEHYSGLGDDVRFRQDLPSARELKEEEKELKKTVAELNKYVAEQQKESAQFDAETTAVLNDYEKKTLEAGYTKEQADGLKHIYRFIPVMADKMGISPKELADKVGIKIIKSVEDKMNGMPDFPEDPRNIERARLLQTDDLGKYKYDPDLIQRMVTGVKQGEAGYRMPKGETGESVGVPSSFPSWFKNQGYTKKYVLNIFAKHLDGKVLTEKESDTLANMYKDAVDAELNKEWFQRKKTQTDTPEFKAWFGDSKVVDENGMPLVVYHGSGNKFEVFDYAKIGQQGRSEGAGFYFTSNKNIAKGYAKKDGQLVSSFLSIQKPMDYDEKGFDSNDLESILIKASEMESVENDMSIDDGFLSNWGGLDGAINLLTKEDKAIDQMGSLIGSGLSVEILNKAVFEVTGFDGIQSRGFANEGGDKIYIAFFPTQIKSAIGNRGSFDPNDPNILKQSNLGSFSKIGNQRIIKIFNNKNESTLMHESAHAFLDIIAEYGQTNERVKKDLDGILKWFGVDSYDQVTTEHHEKFARSFETYLYEGKSPIEALRKAFNTFKVWLQNIYKQAIGIQQDLEDQLGRKLRPDEKLIDDNIRQIFDSMLATDEELSIARGESGLVDLKIEDQAIQSAKEDAIIESEAFALKKRLQEIEIKRSREYRKQYEELQETFVKQLGSQPIYNVFSVLRHGTTVDGQIFPVTNLKVDINSIPKDRRIEVPKGTSSTDGLHYRDVADMLGYVGDPEGFLRDYLETPEIDEQARNLADQYIKLNFPELRESATDKDVLTEALHLEKRSQMLRFQYDYLINKARPEFNKMVRRMISREPIDLTVRKQAQRFVGKLTVNELKAYHYLRAERKSSRDAAIAFTRGDFEAAAKAKKQELLNHEIIKSINEANRHVEKSFRKFKDIFKKTEDLAKTRDMDFVNAARAILERYGITKKRMDSPFDYLKKVKEYAPDVYNSLGEIITEAINGSSNYKDASYDKFLDMTHAVDALWDMSKTQREIGLEDRKMNDALVLEKLSDQISKHTPNIKTFKAKLTKGEKAAVKILGSKASLARVEHWSDYMDLGDFHGAFKDFIFRPVRAASVEYRLKLNEVVNKYKSILDGKQDLFIKESIMAPELGDDVVFKDHGELLMLILHSGNPSNKSKLLRGYGWGTQNEDGSLNSSRFDAFINRLQSEGVLTKRHYDLAQEIWDLLETLKPVAQKAHKQIYGFYFNEITAEKITTQFGDYRGGYVPAKANPDLSKDAEQRKLAQELEGNNSFMYPTTGRGFSKSRIESYAAPLELDINMLGGHLEQVVRFSYVEPTIKDVTRLVMNKSFRANLGTVDEDAQPEMLIPWLQRSATQRVTEASKDKMMQSMDMVASYLKKTVAMQIMTGNVTNAAQQFTGLIVAATEITPMNLGSAVAEYSTNRAEVLENMLSKSKLMKSLMDTNLYEVNDAIQKIIVDPTTFEQAQDFASKHTYFLQTATQNIVNTIVWQAGYNQSVANGMSEPDSITFADEAVTKTQGTMNPEDVARFQVGTATKALFFQFAGYFNMILNQQASKIGILSKTIGIKNGLGKAFYLHMAGFALPSIISGIMVSILGGKMFDDDDENTVIKLVKTSGDSYVKSVFPMFPIVGQLGSTWYNTKFTDAVYDDRINISPVIAYLESSAKGDVLAYKLATGSDIKKTQVKDFLNLVGVASGLPMGMVGRPIGYVMDVESGKAKPKNPVEFTRGLVTGQPGK